RLQITLRPPKVIGKPIDCRLLADVTLGGQDALPRRPHPAPHAPPSHERCRLGLGRTLHHAPPQCSVPTHDAGTHSPTVNVERFSSRASVLTEFGVLISVQRCVSMMAPAIKSPAMTMAAACWFMRSPRRAQPAPGAAEAAKS